nr:pathogenesis-related protein 5-like [Ipomoea batatas]
MVSRKPLFLVSFLIISAAALFSCCFASTFTVTNNCPFTIWPATLSGSGAPPLPTTGFQLDSGESVKIPSAAGWSGRIWARTGCTFDASGVGSCQTGDCEGKLECGGMGATPPASLFEITLGQGDVKDFYDGEGEVVGCKSACEAFGLAQYCCSGEFANPSTCKPSFYSTIFKRACPRAYSYAFDDGTSTFTCKASEYAIVFCPTGAIRSPPGAETANQKYVMTTDYSSPVSYSATTALHPLLTLVLIMFITYLIFC